MVHLEGSKDEEKVKMVTSPLEKCTNGDVFVTAEKLYRAAASSHESNNIWLKAIDGIKIQLNRELVSALRDKTVLSELYILTQEKIDE